MANVGNLQIVIRLNEHPPPHFEVLFDNSKACFRIEDCLQFTGKMKRNDVKKVKNWYRLKGNKQKLINKWNESRPHGCIVGEYRGTQP